MTASTAATATEPLLLTEEQIPVGAVVYVVEPGTSEPAAPDGERLAPLRRMIGGVPARLKLYPVGKDGETPAGPGYENVFETARFLPVETYSPDDAPAETTYAVFVEGVRMLHSDRGSSGPAWFNYVEVYKSVKGSFTDSKHRYGRRMEPPLNARLIPTSALGEGRDPTRPRCRR